MAPHSKDKECIEASTVMQNQRGLAFNTLVRANPEVVELPRSPRENYPARSPPDHNSATQLSQHHENPHRNPGTAMMRRSTPPIASSSYVATQSPVAHAARQRYHHISSGPRAVASELHADTSCKRVQKHQEELLRAPKCSYRSQYSGILRMHVVLLTFVCHICSQGSLR